MTISVCSVYLWIPWSLSCLEFDCTVRLVCNLCLTPMIKQIIQTLILFINLVLNFIFKQQNFMFIPWAIWLANTFSPVTNTCTIFQMLGTSCFCRQQELCFNRYQSGLHCKSINLCPKFASTFTSMYCIGQ